MDQELDNYSVVYKGPYDLAERVVNLLRENGVDSNIEPEIMGENYYSHYYVVKVSSEEQKEAVRFILNWERECSQRTAKLSKRLANVAINALFIAMIPGFIMAVRGQFSPQDVINTIILWFAFFIILAALKLRK